MQYCTNCGSVLNEGTKFCSGCGDKVSLSGKGKKPSKKKTDNPLMEKGVVKSLKKGITNQIKSKIQKPLSHKPDISRTKKSPITNQDVFHANSTNEIKSGISTAKKLMIYYFLLNIPLYFINTGDDEILGILIFSVIIILMYIRRIKYDKPFNIILKIVIGLQSLLMLASIMINIENLGSSLSSVIALITLIALLFFNGKIIAKGNKTN